MKFDVVIGNPPYNKDLYLHFVNMGNNLARVCSLSITPAKWQAKGGNDNDNFRQNIVPYMKKIVYYPYCKDVFDIWEASGVCYYIIDKNEKHPIKDIENICSTQKYFNSKTKRTLGDDFTLLNICDEVIKKINIQEKFFNKTYSEVSRYQIWMNDKPSGGLLFSLNKGSLLVLEPAVFVDTASQCEFEKTTISKLIYSSNSKEEALSFLSWVNTKFIRFLILARACVVTGILNEYCWNFVPEPIEFDHIFTDEELYKQYGLTDNEINSIESIIRDRKGYEEIVWKTL